MILEPNSEVAKFRQQQAMEERAALLGLKGLASGVSRHDFIEARMERGAERILQLLEEGEHEEAQRLLETRSWGQKELEGGEGSLCLTTISSCQKHNQ